jgi:hypothetical protein
MITITVWAEKRDTERYDREMSRSISSYR